MTTEIRRVFAFVAMAVVFGIPGSAWAVPVSVSWTSNTFTASSDSRLGDISNFTSLSGPAPLFAPPTVPASLQDAQSATGAVLPQAVSTSKTLNVGLVNERQSFGGASITGSAAGIMTTTNGGFTRARNLSDVTTHGAEAIGTTIFLGEFTSNGTTLDLTYDGLYNLFAFGANNQGLSLNRQRAFAAISATFLVEDLSASSTLLSNTLVSDSRLQGACGNPCLPFSVDNAAFSGVRSVDLTGTAGNNIKVTLATATRTVSYAGHESFDSSGQQTGADARANFGSPQFGGGFNYQLTTGEGTPDPSGVPEPATLGLFVIGLIGLGTMRRRRKVA